MLKSTDASKFEEWTFFGSHRFLDGSTGVSDHKVGFCSFPRSGSSFLRRMIENLIYGDEYVFEARITTPELQQKLTQTLKLD